MRDDIAPQTSWQTWGIGKDREKVIPLTAVLLVNRFLERLP